MKLLPFIIVLLLLFQTSSCKKVDKLTQFTKEIESEVTLPSALGINLPFNIPTPPITTNIEEDLEVENSRKDLIEYAQLTYLKLTITEPSDKTFKWLNDAEIFIKADGLEEVRVAFIHDISSSVGDVIELSPIEKTNVSEYIKKDEFTLRLKVITDEISLESTDIKIESKIFIDAKILGV